MHPATFFLNSVSRYLSQAFTEAGKVLKKYSTPNVAYGCACFWQGAQDFAKAAALERDLADANEALQKARHEVVEAILVRKVLTEDATAAVERIVKGGKCLHITRMQNGKPPETVVFYDPLELNLRPQSPPPPPAGQRCMGFSVHSKARCTQTAVRTFEVLSTQFPTHGLAHETPSKVTFLYVCGQHGGKKSVLKKMPGAVVQVAGVGTPVATTPMDPPTTAAPDTTGEGTMGATTPEQRPRQRQGRGLV